MLNFNSFYLLNIVQQRKYMVYDISKLLTSQIQTALVIRFRKKYAENLLRNLYDSRENHQSAENETLPPVIDGDDFFTFHSGENVTTEIDEFNSYLNS